MPKQFLLKQSNLVHEVNNICKSNFSSDELEKALEALIIKYRLSLLSQNTEELDELREKHKKVLEENENLKQQILQDYNSSQVLRFNGKPKTRWQDIPITQVRSVGYADLILPEPSDALNVVFR